MEPPGRYFGDEEATDVLITGQAACTATHRIAAAPPLSVHRNVAEHRSATPPPEFSPFIRRKRQQYITMLATSFAAGATAATLIASVSQGFTLELLALSTDLVLTFVQFMAGGIFFGYLA